MQVNYKKQLVLEKIISPTLSQPSSNFKLSLKRLLVTLNYLLF